MGNLSGHIQDTDPQETGVKPLPPKALSEQAGQTTQLVQEFIRQARGILEGEDAANMVLLRGFSKRPSWPSIPEVFGLRAVAIAVYPMYRGVAKLAGMEALHASDGDHSTPSWLKYHSWRPVPVLLWSQYCRSDAVDRFGERACMTGGLGPRFPATDLMPLALAYARRLEKFGA